MKRFLLISMAVFASGCSEDPVATEPVQDLEILRIDPADSSLDLPLDQAIEVEFSNAMMRDLTVVATTIDPATSVDFEWSSDAKTLVIKPEELWEPDISYSVTIDGSAKDTNHQSLGETVTVTLETGSFYVLATQWGGKGTTDGSFRTPYGSEIDDLNHIIYITDCRNARVQKFGLDGTLVGAWGTLGAGEGQLNTPADVKLDSDGKVYVVEERNHRVQIFDEDGGHIGFVGSYGVGAGEFNNPLGVALDSQNDLYVVDYGNHRIQKFSPDGNFLFSWGTYGTADGEFNGPYYIEIDSRDFVYVVDRDNHRVQKFTSEGEFVTKWGRNGGDGTSGYLEGEFDYPHEIAVGPDNNVYVADTYNGRIQVHTSEGEFVRTFEVSGWPKTVAVDQAGTVFVSDVLGVGGNVVSAWAVNLTGITEWSPPASIDPELPTLLSEFDVYPSAPDLTVHTDAAINYEPEWPLWSNGSEKDRFLLMPSNESIDVSDSNKWDFPEDIKFFKTFSYARDGESAQRPRPIETRLIWKRDGDWTVASYLWKADGSDAELLDGSEPVDIPVVDSAGRAFRHIVPSREECNVCHQASPGFVLGFSEIQLNHQLPGHSSTQFSRLIESGTLMGFAGGPVAKVTDPDESTRLVKGYVQGNCVQCHNGGVAIDFGHETFLQNTVNVAGRDGILIVPGNPDQSSLYRLFSEGGMPPLGVQLIDSETIDLLGSWITELQN